MLFEVLDDESLKVKNRREGESGKWKFNEGREEGSCLFVKAASRFGHDRVLRGSAADGASEGRHGGAEAEGRRGFVDERGASDNVHSTPNAIVLKRGFKRMFGESRRRQRGCAAGGTRLGDEGLRKVTVACSYKHE